MNIATAVQHSFLSSLLLLVVANAHSDEPRTVTFPAADGLLITADYYGLRAGQHPFVILLHDARCDRTGLAPIAQALAQERFAVLALDLRGHGDSATTETRDAVRKESPGVFQDMQHDLRGAYDWLAQQPEIDRARFAMVGVGVGASVALQYAAKDRSVDVIVAILPQLNPAGLDSRGDLGQIKGRRVLLLGTPGGRDALYSLRTGGDHVEVQILESPSTQPEQLLAGDVSPRREVIEFLQKGVGGPSSRVMYGSIESHIYHAASSGWLARISPTNLRHFSSPEEAESRGVRAARSTGPRDSGRESPPRTRQAKTSGARSGGGGR